MPEASRADPHPAAAPAERDASVVRSPQVVEERPAVGDRLVTRPAELLDHVGHRLGDDHVARRDAVCEAEAAEGSGRAVHGEHDLSCTHRPVRRLDAGLGRAEHPGALMEAGSRGEQSGPEAKREACGVHRGGGLHERARAELRGVAPRAHLGGCEWGDLLRRTDLGACVDRLVEVPDLGVAGRHVERRRRVEPGVDAFGLAERADAAHATLRRPDDLERPLVADAVTEDGEVVPEGRDEATVAPARTVPCKPCLEHDHVGLGRELLELPGRPHPEVAAADDRDVGRSVPLERTSRLHRPGVLEPPAVPRVPHAFHRG